MVPRWVGETNDERLCADQFLCFSEKMTSGNPKGICCVLLVLVCIYSGFKSEISSRQILKDWLKSRPSRRSEPEIIPGLIGDGRWRRLKGGVTMDSGCSIDTMPLGHAPTIKMGHVPPERANQRINAANSTCIREHGKKHSDSEPVMDSGRTGRCW